MKILNLIILILFGSLYLGAQTRAKVMLDSFVYAEKHPSPPEIIKQLHVINNIATANNDFPTNIETLNFLCSFYSTANDLRLMDSVINVALNIAKDTSKINDVTLSYVLNNAAYVQDRKGNLKAASQLYLESIEVEKSKRGDHYQLSILYHNLSSNYRLLGDYESALDFSIKALESIKMDTSKNKELEHLDEYYLVALNYQSSKEYEKAIQVLEEGLIFAKNCTKKTSKSYLKSSKEDKTQYNRSIIKLTYGIAENLLALKKPQETKTIISKLKLLQNTTAYRKYKAFELEGLYNQQLGNFIQAQQLLNEAIKIASEDNSTRSINFIFTELQRELGDIYLDQKLFQEAISAYDQGIELLNLDNTEIDLKVNAETLNILSRRAKALKAKSEASSSEADASIAKEAYLKIISYLDRMKTSYLNEGSKFFIAEKATDLYGEAIEVFYNDYLNSENSEDSENIFMTMEKNKAGVLLENLKYKFNLLESSLPKEVIEKNTDFKSQISFYKSVLSGFAMTPELDSLQKIKKKEAEDILFSAKEDYSIFNSNLKSKYPEYESFQSSIGQTKSIKEIQSFLKKGELLIEYLQTDSKLFKLEISKDDIDISTSNNDEVNRLIPEYRNLLNNAPSRADNPDIINNVSKDLGKILLPNSIDQYKKITIVPDGNLTTIPFESLVLDDNSFLIEKSLINYVYSAEQLLTERKESSSAPEVLCIAPVFENQKVKTRASELSEFNALPYAQEEAQYLKDNFDGIHISSVSTAPSDLLENIANFPIIHLVTHTSLNTVDPMMSEIHFNGGSITNYDIRDLQVRPDFVVLSACNTAQGNIQKGEGIISLSRGFFEAGVKSLQSSLWSINDYSSSKIVRSMYGNMKSGQSNANALRKAKLDYIGSVDKLRAHPYYWAGIIQIGQDNVLFKPNFNSTYLIVGAILLSLLLLLVYRKRK